MKILKIMIVMLILIMSVGTVCATDDISTDNQQILENSQNNVYTTSESSFTNLSDEIKNAGTYLELTKDYAFNNESDNYTGILIEKDNFVLNGEGHIVDGKFQSRIFYITGNNVTISNINLINGNIVSTSGGAIYSTGSITLNNIIFNSNTAYSGGAIYANDETVINNVLFSENKAIESGGALYMAGKTILNNVTFNNNQANYSGAIYINGETTINNSIFINNKNINYGAIFVGKKTTIRNSTFENNLGKYGGAINCDNYADIINCNFNNNVAEWGGSIYSTNKTNIVNSSFANSISKYAAAIYAEGNISIVNSIFKNLHANETSGAVALKKYMNATISNCTFINITAVKNGGALYIDASYNTKTPIYIKDSRFINTSGDFGGALVQLNGILTVQNCIFVNNTAKCSGAAIYESFTSSAIANCVFESNKILDENFFDGGAIYADFSGIELTDSTFTNNTKNAVYSYDSYLTTINSTFKNNGEAVHAVFGNNTLVNNTFNKDILVLNDTNYIFVVAENSMKFELINNTINVTNIPARFDLRDWGWVTPVKNQGSMGSCWVFGAIAALESSLLKATGITYDLSENNLQNSMLAYSKYGDDNITEAGLPDQDLTYLLSWLGPLPSEFDTYDELGKLSPEIISDKNIHIQDVMILKPTKDLKDNDIYKKAIMKYGAVNIAYYACNEAPYYNEKTHAQYRNNTTEANHQVALVGWDDNFSKEKFLITPPGDGAWIIKNSWDTTWGENGYAYISYYDLSILKDQKQPVFIIENTENYTKNYQTDLGGFISIEQYTNDVSYKVTYESCGNDLISAVGTYFNDEGEAYSLEIYVNNKLVHTQNGTAPYHGFHTIKLEKEIPIKKSDNFTAIMTKESIPFISESRQHYLKNQCFINYDNKWEDISLQNQTFTLKVYTKEISIFTEDLVKIYKNDSQFVANIGDVNKTVIFEINGKNYTRLSDKDGNAVMVINLGPGNYTIKTTYNNSTVENTITVLPTLMAEDLVKFYRNASQFDITLINGEGKAVSGKNITMNINGIFYIRTTNENGTARLNINLPPGEYILTAIDPVTGLQMSYSITVLPVLNASDITMKYRDGTQFIATVLDGEGNPYKEQIVTFNVNGVLYNRITDSNGQAKLNINLMAGEYIITSSYNGFNIANKITIIS